MSLFRVAALACALLGLARSATAQHEHRRVADGFDLQWGAQAIGLLTHATPAMLGRDLTEGYITQPAIMTHASVGKRLSFRGMLDLEGLSLLRGELNHGVWGEGYIDRRHPHTYLHEAVLTAEHSLAGVDLSVSAGKGFAPFGTDDPMVRPFVKYPANHHLSQILERLIVVGAVRKGPLMLEYGIFNGDEPAGPRSLGTIDRIGDSWSGRLTVSPLRGVEIQGSAAYLESPERPGGGGLNQRKRSLSARADVPLGKARVYGLVEAARTMDLHGLDEVFRFESLLAEASASLGANTLSLRYENTVRPEEDRQIDLFRSVRPASDNSILGRTRFRTVSASMRRDVSVAGLRTAPFLEVSRSAARSVESFPVFPPDELFGNENIWLFSAGIRFGAGMKHSRMGRYGVAINRAL